MDRNIVTPQGIKIPKIGFGTAWAMGEEGVRSILGALEIGYRHIDTARLYNNEQDIGAAIKQSGIPREQLFLTTKIWHDQMQPDVMAAHVEESLGKLGTEYLDLLLLHWPPTTVSLEEACAALETIHQSGKTRLIGVSNFTVSMIKKIRDTLKIPIICNQVEYHPLLSQKTVLACLREYGMFLTAYSPLARGKVLDNELVKDIAATLGKSPAQIALRWLAQQDDVIVIPKASRRANAVLNFDIFSFSLNNMQMSALTALSERENFRLFNPDHAPQWDNAE
jgi:diketogulonate reductase-like aldo/keto reductase